MQADRPDDAANLEPYPLIATVRKKFKLVRGAETEPVSLPLDQDGLCKVEVESGDYLLLDYWHFKSVLSESRQPWPCIPPC